MPGTDIASWMISMEFLNSKKGSQGEEVWIEKILILIHRLNGSRGKGATAGGTIRAASRAMSGILNMTELPSTKGALITKGARVMQDLKGAQATEDVSITRAEMRGIAGMMMRAGTALQTVHPSMTGATTHIAARIQKATACRGMMPVGE